MVSHRIITSTEAAFESSTSSAGTSGALFTSVYVYEPSGASCGTSSTAGAAGCANGLLNANGSLPPPPPPNGFDGAAAANGFDGAAAANGFDGAAAANGFEPAGFGGAAAATATG